jgi:hypothetical protein
MAVYPPFAAGRGFRALAVPLVMMGLLAGARSAGPSAPACQAWTGVQPLNPGTSANVLSSVAVISACNVWVVGSDSSGGGTAQTLIEHWNGSAWTVVASPDPGSAGNFLTGVQAASPTDIWAVGSFIPGPDLSGGISTLIVHWNGTSWTQVASPSPRLVNQLDGVRVLSASDAWAVGDTGDSCCTLFTPAQTPDPPPPETLILHWNGTRWARVASPSPGSINQLHAVSALSRRDAWAVGGTDIGTLILHWNGSRWAQVASPVKPPGGSLAGVGATSRSNAWAVGSVPNGTASQTLILHWNGTRWRRVPSPNPGGSAHDNALTGVAVTSAGNAWAVGSYTSGAVQKTLILHWNGSAWTRVTSPDPGTSNQLAGVRAVSASDAWAVGSFSSGTPSQALAVHCC